MFVGKGVLKICSKFTWELPCRSAISIKLLCNFLEIILRHGCSPVNYAAYFQNAFSWEHLWVAASVYSYNYHKDKTFHRSWLRNRVVGIWFSIDNEFYVVHNLKKVQYVNFFENLLLKPGPGPWTLDPEKRGKQLDMEKWLEDHIL